VGQTLLLFGPHPNLSDTVNRQIIQSEIEGGVFLADLPPATVLEIQTQHRYYMAVTMAENSVLSMPNRVQSSAAHYEDATTVGI